jgi:hypothetical protein
MFGGGDGCKRAVFGIEFGNGHKNVRLVAPLKGRIDRAADRCPVILISMFRQSSQFGMPST